MAKESRRKLLFITVFLSILLISSAYAASIPNVQAAKISSKDMGLTILNDVVGLDMVKYATNIKEYPQDSYMGVLPQENVRYELTSGESRLKILCTFTNGKLQMIDVFEREGSPRMTKPVTSVLEMAKGFLSNYQSYSRNSFYGELRSTLANVDANKNLTTTSGNAKLEVTAYGNRTTFRWTYTINGVVAPDKCVALGYENGFLEYFIDNWDLYKIGSTSINLSEKEAIAIAMERAKTFSWKVGSGNNTFEVKNFNVTQAMVWETVFCSSLYADEARSQDLLMLYPMRHVWVSLDKFYPGNVYGINVYVWADTEEICHIQERFSILDPPSDEMATIDESAVGPLNDQASVVEAKPNSMLITWIVLPAFAAVVIGIAPFWLGRKKNLPKLRSFKIGGVLLCLLISSTMLLVPIATVNADHECGRSEIWGSESIGAYDPRLPGYWRKTQDEVLQQRSTAQYINNRFSQNGYDASNNQGSNSLKNLILDDISYNEQNYPRVAVVDFDHGVGEWPLSGEFHYMFEDNNGTIIGPSPGNDPQYGNPHRENAVFDMDIYPRTSLGNTFFAFINTCQSANTSGWYGGYYVQQGIIPGTDRARGMPLAWTHRLVKNKWETGFNTALHMSDNGYLYPDNGDFVFLGFPLGAASLSQTVSGSWPYYHTWVEEFFAYALIYDYSVIQALDVASRILFQGNNFDQTPLCTGFTVIWPFWYPEYHWVNKTGPGRLVVYGNGNIHLYQKGGIWNLDEGQGSTAHDSSSHHNDGTIYGATWTTGKIGSALSFDGVNDYVEVPDSSSLKPTNAITIMAWAKFDVINDWAKILNKPLSNVAWDYPYVAWDLSGSWANAKQPYSWMSFTDGTAYTVQSSDPITTGVWYHLVATYNGIDMKLYVNGILKGTTNVGAKTLNQPTTKALIGRRGDYSVSEIFDGIIDEVRIYDRALSEGEIASYYAANRPNFWLQVYAYNDDYNWQLYPIMEIDGQWVGWGSFVGTVPQGTHTIAVDNYVWDPYYGYFVFNYYTYDSTIDYNNPMTLQVSDHKTVVAHYYWWGW